MALWLGASGHRDWHSLKCYVPPANLKFKVAVRVVKTNAVWKLPVVGEVVMITVPDASTTGMGGISNECNLNGADSDLTWVGS